MGLADKTLTEQDYRTLILDEYTFLRRRCSNGRWGRRIDKAQVAAARDLLS